MKSIPTLTCRSELFIQRISSVFTEQSQIGAKSSLEQSLENEVILDPKVLGGRPEKFK